MNRVCETVSQLNMIFALKLGSHWVHPFHCALHKINVKPQPFFNNIMLFCVSILINNDQIKIIINFVKNVQN